MKKKIVSLVLVFALALALGIGGTVAWLTAETNKVVNTFTVGDIEITLAETNDPEFDFVPGDNLAKDPYVIVTDASEDCWVFVKVTETNNKVGNLQIIQWAIAGGWNETSDANVWYKVITDDEKGEHQYILAGDVTYPNGHVTISGDVTEEIAEGLETAKPQLTFDAFAHQSKNTNIETATAAALAHFAAETNQ